MFVDTVLSGCLFAAMAFAVGLCFCAAHMFRKDGEYFVCTCFAGMGVILLMLVIGLTVIFIERGA